ncbi:ADP-L-glycero-D-manno-heptose-6-epimerase [Thermodesulfomicrobium sp. WS]|uniref:ADP-glyceromanno-heptose 6-epimerase n=1 Tax=Thermodesulfomicrobium sp. WS TaxID=3004129 RepID=UPI0024938BF3|nr:ADP-glyceromanno-heptose 6-epimerase [Thermodesulfomicrobium sp. WS]BDV01725.1 ADP-L-glycero-D-manno-heptose-6-epimerase [Thermodesulfomicrobium sp. WS]
MIIVTGGAGFLGSAIVWGLNRRGVDDILVVDNLGCTEKWKNLVGLRYRDYVHKDEFAQRLRNSPWAEPVEAVIHMGACSSTTERDADYLMRNNVEYSKLVCRFALEQGARFVYASSAATYGDGGLGFEDDDALLDRLSPLNMYGYSKHLFDLWVREEGLLDAVAGLKFFNVFGPNEYHKGEMRSVVCKAVAEIAATDELRLFCSHRPDYAHGEQQRDFVYVEDCVEVVLWLLENTAVGGIFNVGTGRSRTWNDLARAVFAAMGREPRIRYIPMPEAIREKYQYYTCASMAKLRSRGCTVPFRSLEEAVTRYVQDFLLQGPAYLRSR